MSSSCIDVAAAAAVPEQLCYIPCNFCNIVLAVSVPCSSLFDIVTVRCGHCTNLWSVNMAAAFHSLSSSSTTTTTTATTATSATSHHHRHQDNPSFFHQTPTHTTPTTFRVDLGSSPKLNNKVSMRPPTAITTHEQRIVNRPPEKRQRVPSAYNQFIKEEIQRIKANNPDISHREAFSTAAKNWAHFPHIHFGLMLETNNQAKVLDELTSVQGSEKRLRSRASLLK